jgi:hypothetical protein
MVVPSLLQEFYYESEEQGLADIRYLQTDMGVMTKIREENPGDWELEELTRAIIFDEAQTINLLIEEIEHVREARKELAGI